MRRQAMQNGVHRISMPRLACGLDGLLWTTVRKLIQNIFKQCSIKITVYFLKEFCAEEEHLPMQLKHQQNAFRMSTKDAAYAVTVPVANHVYQALMQAEGTYSALRCFIRMELGITEKNLSNVSKTGKLCATTKLGGNGPMPWKLVQGDAERAVLSVVQDCR